MAGKIKNVLSSFFAKNLTQQVKELYSANLILNFAVSMVTIFEPVFLYLLFKDQYSLANNLRLILLFYLAVYVIYFLVQPLGAKFARHFGYEHSMALGTVFTALFYLSLFGAKYFIWLLPFSILFYVGWKMFYWPAYNCNFAHFATEGQQGRQVSNLVVMNSLVAVAAPIIGGIVLKFFGFPVLFIMVAVLMILSNIPTLITKEQFKPSSISYFDAYKRLFSKKNRKRFWAHVGYGEELIVLVIWPIFMYLIVKDFLSLGAVAGVSTLVATIIFLFIGKFTDKGEGRSILRLGTWLYFFGWLFRIVTRGVGGVFMLDAFTRTAKQAVSIPFTALTYKRGQDTSVIKTILFFEMALVFGKIIAMVLALILLQFFVPGWNALFILAGMMTLLYLLF